MGLTNSSTGRHALSGGGPRSSPLPAVALAGNPNVGKSTVFNALTGLRQHTGNWTGKTVSLASGRIRSREIMLVDLPGCRSLDPASKEEAVSRDFLTDGNASAVIVVVDASRLARSLALALEIMALRSRVIILVNLIDEAEKHGISIDCALLEKRLGVPVLPCSARNGRGLDRLLEVLDGVIKAEETPPRTEYRAFLPENGGEASAACLKECERLTEGAVKTQPQKAGLTERIDRIVTGRFTAFPIMLLMLLFVFYITIIGANYPSELLSTAFSRLESPLLSLLDSLRVAPWLSSALVLGMFRTVGWVVSVMLPPMAIFFPLFTLLEDLGFLPRAAFCLDRCFRCAGSCGKQALTMTMGFGCNAAGVVGCRIIPNERERVAAIVTNSFVPCNGRFPLLISLSTLFLADSGLGAAALLALFIVLSVVMTLAATRLIGLLLPGSPSGFLMELPPYRVPKVGKVIVRSVFDRTLHVLGRAAAVAAPAGLVIYAAANIGVGGRSLLTAVCSFLDPFARVIGLDGAMLTGFILGFPANEIVLPVALMAYTSNASLASVGGAELGAILTSNGWTAQTALSAILFSLFHWPCSTTCLTIRKEAGTKWMLLGMALPTAVGIALLLIVNLVFRLFA